jgi:hypothetical protein
MKLIILNICKTQKKTLKLLVKTAWESDKKAIYYQTIF